LSLPLFEALRKRDFEGGTILAGFIHISPSEEVHDILMSLFYLIKEHNRVGAPWNSFEELTAFFST